jgi:hypothetical protein
MIDQVRTLIVSEMKRRLTVAFPNITIYEGGGSVWGEWTRTLPCFHVYEMTADVKGSDTANRGTYRTVLPVQVEYVTKLNNRTLLFTEGRSKLFSLQQAIELDRRFGQNAGTQTPGQELVVSYHMTANEIVEVIPSVVDVAVLYDFIFIEKFYGY